MRSKINRLALALIVLSALAVSCAKFDKPALPPPIASTSTESGWRDY